MELEGEKFVEKFVDLVHNSLNTRGFELIYGDTIDTKNGTFEVEVSIVQVSEYN